MKSRLGCLLKSLSDSMQDKENQIELLKQQNETLVAEKTCMNGANPVNANQVEKWEFCILQSGISGTTRYLVINFK